MKKVVLWVSIGLMIVGAGLCILALILGAQLPRINSQRIEQPFHITYDNVQELDFVLDGADVLIQEGDGFSLDVQNLDSRYYSSQMDGNEWKLTVRTKWSNFTFQSQPQIIVTLPRDFVAREASIELGATNAKIMYLNTHSFDLSVGAGTLEADGIQANELDVECGMGEARIDGRVDGDVDVKCGMGTVTLNLENQESEYSYVGTVGMGTVVIGSQSAEGAAGKIRSAQRGMYEMEVECGMGEVRVNFGEESE